MKLRLKEDAREWRKSVLLTALGLALLSSLLRWRRLFGGTTWILILSLLVLIAAASFVRPQLFRGFYRVSMRVGFALSQAVARVVLVLVFVFLVTPLALVFRLAGKDALRLKHRKETASYWSDARETSPLDRMF